METMNYLRYNSNNGGCYRWQMKEKKWWRRLWNINLL
jgi:hypothetical protein